MKKIRQLISSYRNDGTDPRKNDAWRVLLFSLNYAGGAAIMTMLGKWSYYTQNVLQLGIMFASIHLPIRILDAVTDPLIANFFDKYDKPGKFKFFMILGKNVIYEEGDHNSSRSKFFRDSASIFFYNTLQVPYIKEISDNYAGFKFMLKNEDDHKQNEEVNNNNEIMDDNIGFGDDLNEEEIFQKILEMSKEEYAKSQKKPNENNNDSNKRRHV